MRTAWSRPANVVTANRRDLRSLPRAALRRIAALHTVDVVRRPTAQVPPAVRAGAGFALHRVTAAGDPLLARAPIGARRRRQIPAAIARGDLAYLATVDDQVVGWVWLSQVSHRDRWSGLRFRLTPAECYAYDMWSRPEYRALGAGAFLMAGLLHDLAEDPTREWVYGYVDRANAPNQLLLRMVFGFKTVQVVKHLSVLNALGWQIPLTDRPPRGPCSRS
jgi:ribosomal protein S18 acetylase RimI-like enzyme